MKTLRAVLFNLPALFLMFSEDHSGFCICTVWQPQRPSISHVQAVGDKQRLTVSWPVNNSCSMGGIYEIQISYTENHRIIYSENVSVGYSDVDEHTWTWSSDLPLECVDHSVRIRQFQNRWEGPWSSWMTNRGEDENDSCQIFPSDRVLSQRSAAKFCCVPSKGANVTHMEYGGREFNLSSIGGRVKAITVHNLTLPTPDVDIVLLHCRDSTGSRNNVWNYISCPPQKPANLSCVTSDLTSVLCTWYPGPKRPADDHNKQSHTLHIATPRQAPVRCTPSSCRFRAIPGLEQYNISLVVKDLLGEETGSYSFNISERVSPVVEWDRVIPGVTNTSISWNVLWNLTQLGLLCEVTKGSDSIFVSCNNVRGLCKATLEHLLPNTRYSTRVHCSVDGRLWGDWTPEISFTTYPLVTLDVWRTIEQQADPHTRKVTLLWTPNIAGTAMRVNIQGYEVQWSQEGRIKTEKTGSKQIQALVCEGPGRCDVTVKALLQKGSSVPAHITVPPAEDRENLPAVTRLSGDNTAGFRLSWKQQDGAICGYTVEWCILGKTEQCTLRWMKVPEGNSTLFLPAELFQVARRYTFNIYGCTENGHRLLERQSGYLKELKFVQCPVQVEATNTTSSSVTVKWHCDDDASHPAFITGYLVTGQEDTSDWPTERRRYVFNSSLADPRRRFVIADGLKPSSQYVFSVCALTKVGPGPVANITINTRPDYSAHLAKILAPVVLLLGCIPFLWPQRNKLQSVLKGIFAYPAGMRVKIPELDSFIFETAERLQLHAEGQEEECIGCEVEIINIKPPPSDALRDPGLPLMTAPPAASRPPSPLSLSCVTLHGDYCPQSATSITNKMYFHCTSTEEEPPEPQQLPPSETLDAEPTDSLQESCTLIYGYVSNEILASLGQEQ